jgi:hypothetical protein
LKIIIVESVGVSKNIIQEIANAQLPDLEHLELYLGHYGFNNTIEDLESIMNGGKFPNLNYLALKNSYIQDEIALKIANAPILDQIEILDLSLGLLTDVGAQALLESSNVKKLKLLNLEYNYISNEMAEKMEVLGIEVRVGGQKIPDVHDGKEYRYIDVIE